MLIMRTRRYLSMLAMVLREKFLCNGIGKISFGVLMYPLLQLLSWAASQYRRLMSVWSISCSWPWTSDPANSAEPENIAVVTAHIPLGGSSLR